MKNKYSKDINLRDIALLIGSAIFLLYGLGQSFSYVGRYMAEGQEKFSFLFIDSTQECYIVIDANDNRFIAKKLEKNKSIPDMKTYIINVRDTNIQIVKSDFSRERSCMDIF